MARPLQELNHELLSLPRKERGDLALRLIRSLDEGAGRGTRRTQQDGCFPLLSAGTLCKFFFPLPACDGSDRDNHQPSCREAPYSLALLKTNS